MRTIDPIRYRALTTRALDSGRAVADAYGVEWWAAARCTNAHQVELVSDLSQAPIEGWAAAGGKNEAGEWEPLWNPITGTLPEVPITNSHFMKIQVTCRKCQACLNMRRNLWAVRAYNEVLQHHRTWFATFTVSPEWRYKFSCEAGSDDNKKVAQIVLKHFTKFLKRVRKQTKAKFRYIVVVENHKDGYPHLHALFHEVGETVPKRVWQGQWPYGFTTFKLSDPDSVRYLTKYLSKQIDARVRASLRYGSRPITSLDIWSEKTSGHPDTSSSTLYEGEEEEVYQ